MRARLYLAVLALAVFCSPSIAWSAPPPSDQMPNQTCYTLGMTGMAADRSTLLACTLITPSPSSDVTDCTSGGGCVWKTMGQDDTITWF